MTLKFRLRANSQRPPHVVRRRLSRPILLLALLAAGCAQPPGADTPPQRWKDLDIRVETRPSPPVNGMNEFLIMATGERGRPAYDLVVSLRTADSDPWKQAIEDGQVGVYRRAALLDTAAHRTALQVAIRRGDSQGVLTFPLSPSP